MRLQRKAVIDRRFFLLIAGAVLARADRGHAADDLADMAARLASESNLCAVAVATLKGGQEARSLSASGCGSNPASDAVFQAASLSKPFVAYLALRMVQRGELSLDKPLSDILPSGYRHRQNIFALKAAPIVDLVPVDILRRVTPRMLLTHSSGFPNWSSNGALTPTFTPGTRWQYSGEGYVLLQQALETISQRPLQQLAEAELFGPLGLTSSAFKLTDSILPRLIPGSPKQLRFPYEIAPSSLYTSAADYVRFTAAVLSDKKMLALITSEPVKLPTSWGSAFRSTSLAWGLGWGIEASEAPAAIWHWGSNPGFRSLVMADLRSRDAIVVLTSADDGMPVAKTLVNAAIPGEHPGLELELVR
jgi:CubicO group peptidase (beta-lactamase class C family)